MGPAEARAGAVLPLRDNRLLPNPAVPAAQINLPPGLCPGPRGLAHWFPGGSGKGSEQPPHCLPQTHPGAHVAPQRCTILRDGKAKGSITNLVEKIYPYELNCP